MRDAMVAETRVVGRPPSLQVNILRWHALPAVLAAGDRLVTPDNWLETWPAALSWADAVWLVAPETAGELESLSRAIEQSGARLLGCQSDGVAVAASKRATYAALEGRVVQPARVTPATAAVAWVVKPNDGVAAQGVRRCAAGGGGNLPPMAGRSVSTARSRRDAPDVVTEAFVDGTPISLCVLSDGHQTSVLSVNQQSIQWDSRGRARYRGGVVNAFTDRARFRPMVAAVQRAIPGLWGYWGIDCVLPDEGEPVLIEVNPRLTTPFAHLRAATGFDLLDALLAVMSGAPPAAAAAGQAVAFGVSSGRGDAA